MSKIVQLKDFQLLKMSVKWHFPKGNASKIYAQHATNYEVLVHPKKSDEYALEIKHRLQPDNKYPEAGYEIEAVIRGVFSVPEPLLEERQKYLFRYNGILILYGILRGEVAAFTGSFPGGKLILPTIDPKNVIEQVEAAKAEKESKSSELEGAKSTPRKKKTKSAS